MKKTILTFIVCVLIASFLAWANWPHEPLPAGTKADTIVIEKSKRILTIYSKDHKIRSYPISLGSNPVGPKEKEGDRKTPEGSYSIIEHKRDSAFFRALRVSYPEKKDIAHAERLGVNPGSDIMIHGIRNGLGFIGRAHRWFDWTAGCVALTNPEIEELFSAVTDDAKLEIRK